MIIWDVSNDEEERNDGLEVWRGLKNALWIVAPFWGIVGTITLFWLWRNL